MVYTNVGDDKEIIFEASGSTIIGKEKPSVTLISFICRNRGDNKKTYQCEDGMTWQQFIDSSYNDGNFTTNGYTAYYHNMTMIGDPYKLTVKIENNYDYNFVEID